MITLRSSPPVSGSEIRKALYELAAAKVADGQPWLPILKRTVPLSMFNHPWQIKGWCCECRNYRSIPFTSAAYMNPRCPKHPSEALDMTLPISGVFALRRGKPVKVGLSAISMHAMLDQEPVDSAQAYLRNVIISSQSWKR